MQPFLKTTIAGLVVLVSACGSAAAAPLAPGTGELDYNLLPLHGLVSEVSECVEIFETAAYPYWVPSEQIAEIDGYGVSSSQARSASEIQADGSNSNCGSGQERAELVLDAFSFIEQELIADGIYEGWSNCLAERGFEGLTTPSDRNGYILAQIYSGSAAIAESDAIERANSLIPDEVELALADRQCQQQEIAPQLEQIAQFQQQVINDAPADVQAQLKG